MRLVLRRVRGARSLLLAAVVATLIAVSFVVGLLAYGSNVVGAAARSTISAAPPDERSLLVAGSAGAGRTDLAAKDAAMRAQFAGGIGGRAVRIFTAGSGVGAQLTGDVGDAVGDGEGSVFANVMFLDDLPAHARLVEGSWAQPGASVVQATLPRAAATVLHAAVGDRIPVTDRRSGTASEVALVGIWQPVDLTDPYWLLTPGVDGGALPDSHSYGPLTLDRADFLATWAKDASVAWSVQPDLAGAGLAELTRIRDGLAGLSTLPDDIGLSGTGEVTTSLDRLADRLARADLVGRSALLTPVLLVIVLGGYALLLIAMLLSEHRRQETALIRARGASRPQLAGFAVREAVLLVLPAVAVAPLLAAAVLDRGLRWAGQEWAAGSAAGSGPWLWAIGGASGLFCAAAMVGPSVRRSGTYIEELGARSRPSRFAVAQRAGIDLALLALAVLAWFQLRRYASPLSGVDGGLGIDPLLVAAPTIGVLAGAVLSLRLLPQLTRLGEKMVDRRHVPATTFGMWQAGRRPHAGPVLLLALATAVSTLAWSMLATDQRSLVDQADFSVGADLRLVEANGFAPVDRTEQLQALPGVAAVVPVSRTTQGLGPEATSTDIIGIDATRAAGVMKLRSDLGPAADLLAAMGAARPELPGVALPAGATRLALTVRVAAQEDPEFFVYPPRSLVMNLTYTAVVQAPDGRLLRIPMGSMPYTDGTGRFEIALPAAPGLTLVRINVDTVQNKAVYVQWSGTLATADDGGTWTALDPTAGGDWVLTDPYGQPLGPAGAGDLAVQRHTSSNGFGSTTSFAVRPKKVSDLVPAIATPAALATLRAKVGDTVPLSLAGNDVRLQLVGELAAVPGTSRSDALIVDLPSLAAAAAGQRPVALTVTEHWVALASGATAGVTAAAAADLAGVTVLDRAGLADAAGREPYGLGGRTALFVAGVGALLLALIGIAVDVRATARRRVGEFAVLQTMGAGSRLLSRAVLAEQTFLAGLGVLVGLAVGVLVAATLAPLVILTPSADRPEPPALLSIPWLPVLGTAVALLVAALGLSGLVAATLGRRLAVARLRIGDEQ